jgi:hypothetical protein
MKRLIFCIIIAMCISIACAGAKPCCNKKANKKAISCKFNQASIEKDENIVREFAAESKKDGEKSYKCNVEKGQQCKVSAKKPWWKFWAKETGNCPCKQAQATANAS